MNIYYTFAFMKIYICVNYAYIIIPYIITSLYL